MLMRAFKQKVMNHSNANKIYVNICTTFSSTANVVLFGILREPYVRTGMETDAVLGLLVRTQRFLCLPSVSGTNSHENPLDQQKD